ncbi:hypothetical protein [Pseudonocardia sp. D17]|uniref:hypothetical protein n=1 Tax=Pseudonocardia sp. D17 TaxID=882661 RepID=UPI002B3D5EDB|nr:hypothetical protein PSD17_55630 [Pseudonocardia sp. D17]
MTLASRISALATRLATEFNTVRGEMATGLAGKANTSHAHGAGDVTSGTLAIARVPTGTSGTTVALGNHSHSYQDADADLTAIAALSPANNDFLQRKSSAWTNRTPAQVVADLAGTSSTTLAAGNRGLPTGGASGQILAKSSASDYAVGWIDYPAALPRGVIARARRNTGNLTMASGTAYKIVELSASLLAGRMYRFRSQAGFYADSGATIADVFLRYTTDGSAPSTSSTVFEHTSAPLLAGVRVGTAITDDFYTPASNQTVRLLLTASIIASTGACYGATSDAWPARITVEDVGLAVAVGGTNY